MFFQIYNYYCCQFHCGDAQVDLSALHCASRLGLYHTSSMRVKDYTRGFYIIPKKYHAKL